MQRSQWTLSHGATWTQTMSPAHWINWLGDVTRIFLSADLEIHSIEDDQKMVGFRMPYSRLGPGLLII